MTTQIATHRFGQRSARMSVGERIALHAVILALVAVAVLAGTVI